MWIAPGKQYCFIKGGERGWNCNISKRNGAPAVIVKQRGLTIVFHTAGTCICFCRHPSWLPFPHWSSAWLIKCMKTIFEGQSLKGLRAKGCQDSLFGNSQSPWLSLQYGSYYIWCWREGKASMGLNYWAFLFQKLISTLSGAIKNKLPAGVGCFWKGIQSSLYGRVLL